MPPELTPAAFAARFRKPLARRLDTDELRKVVQDYTRMLRSEGMLPEKVLVAIKQAVTEGLAPYISQYDDFADFEDHRSAILADASRWVIQEYFAPERPSRADR